VGHGYGFFYLLLVFIINLERVFFGFCFLGTIKLNIMFKEIEAQTYLEQNYPTPEDKVNCQSLILEFKVIKIKLTGSLDLTGFTNLKKLWCGGNKITKLNL